ncbi:helix-turn-helix domain-containing protein [Microbacterium lacticum]|uniref:ArsR/SmtB family transcription factor n=1 Tax=Microbacterium lacticum TaxID=33885 RepID=UPI003A859CF9
MIGVNEQQAIEEKLDRVLALLSEREPATGARSRAKFWALEGLRERLDDDAGDVMLLGAVGLPTGETYDWQQSASVATLLEREWRDAADAISAVAHPVRLAILHAVLSGVRSTAELAQLPDLGTTGQLHHHMRLMLAAGWLQTAGRGHYEVPAPRVVPLFVVLAAALP